MSTQTKIEWADSTFNPWIGCTKISPACDHCYAEAQMDKRLHRVSWGANMARLRTSPAYWRKPLQWDRAAFHECDACGWRGDDAALATRRRVCPACNGNMFRPARRRVFCASLADVFDNEVDPAWRRDLFELILRSPNLDWILLTKRIGNVLPMLEELKKRARFYDEWAMFDRWLGGEPPANVWLGATICNQGEAVRDIPKLLATPARVRFLSIEPMLGPIDLTVDGLVCLPCPNSEGMMMDPTTGAYECCSGCDYTGVGSEWGIDWVIAGGESGPHARPAHPHWFRSLRDQCAAAGVPFMFKQWGEWLLVEADGDLPVTALDGSERCLSGSVAFDTSFSDYDMARVGKKVAGRLLDGREHNEFPRAA